MIAMKDIIQLKYFIPYWPFQLNLRSIFLVRSGHATLISIFSHASTLATCEPGYIQTDRQTRHSHILTLLVNKYGEERRGGWRKKKMSFFKITFPSFLFFLLYYTPPEENRTANSFSLCFLLKGIRKRIFPYFCSQVSPRKRVLGCWIGLEMNCPGAWKSNLFFRQNCSKSEVSGTRECNRFRRTISKKKLLMDL